MNYPAVTTYSEYRYYAMPVWAPDGKSLRLALPPVDPLAKPAQPTSLWRIALDGSQPQQVGSILAVPFFEQPVVFSPDLRADRVRQRSGAAGGKPARAAPGCQRRLRRLGVCQSARRCISWAGRPTASHFAYALGDTQELWVGSLQETPSQPGGGIDGVQDLRWVDSSRMLFWQASGGSYDLYLSGLQGGRLLLDSVAGVLEYDFAP